MENLNWKMYTASRLDISCSTPVREVQLHYPAVYFDDELTSSHREKLSFEPHWN